MRFNDLTRLARSKTAAFCLILGVLFALNSGALQICDFFVVLESQCFNSGGSVRSEFLRFTNPQFSF